jgi:hypothetical protein
MDYLKEIQRRVKEIELSRWGDYFLNDALDEIMCNYSKKYLRIVFKLIFCNNVRVMSAKEQKSVVEF